MSKTLDRSSVETYIALHAQAADIQTRLDALKATLLPELVNGATSPVELPFLLVNRPQARKQADWKGYVFSLLTTILRSKERAEEALASVDARWPVKESPALHVTINKAFALDMKPTPHILLTDQVA